MQGQGTPLSSRSSVSPAPQQPSNTVLWVTSSLIPLSLTASAQLRLFLAPLFAPLQPSLSLSHGVPPSP